jgi:hypothetical protein
MMDSTGFYDTIDKCAACGKEGGDSLKACTACYMVKYCNRDCQLSHRKQHKKECKKRAAELYDEKLFKKVEPGECPICMIPMSFRSNDSSIVQAIFKSCCGKIICRGCIYAMKMSEGKDLCAFCRTPPPDTDEEEVERLRELMDKGNAEAFSQLAGYYARGIKDLPQDDRKANELWLKAGELGCTSGYLNLGISYENGSGVGVDKKKAKHYWELAAMDGNVSARYNLGIIEGRVGNFERSFKHLILAARAGHELSFDMVKEGFQNGLVIKDEYASTLHAHQKIQDEMKSDMRDKAAAMFTN